MPKTINTSDIQPVISGNRYDAMDMLDAHSLAESDLSWSVNAIGDIRQKFREVKKTLQQAYGVHDLYFESLQEFIFMYEYLIESRYDYHKEQAERYKAEYEALNNVGAEL